MDINTQLDGFIIHPLDAFKNSQQEEFIPPISDSTPDIDGFQVHPLDNFFAHEHNINNDNININEVLQENNVFTNNENYETENTFNTNEISTNNFEFEQNQVQDLISSTPAINIDNNDLNYNQYETSENITTQEYPVTYTDSSSINNNINSNSTDIISLNYESNNINTFTTDSYENYSNTNDNINYAKILPTKILPTINQTNDNDNDIIPSSSIDLNPITTEQNEFNEYSVTNPINNEYTIPSDISYSKSTISPSINLESDISLPSSDLLPTYSSTTFANSTSSFNDLNTNNYKVDEYNIETTTPEYKPNYKETSYNPKINWKKIIPIKTKIIIPKVKKYIIQRKSKIIVPKTKNIIVPTVIVQPQQTINMSQIQPTIPQNYINMLPNQPILINPMPLTNQNSLLVNSSVMEKYPKDNFISNYGGSRVYYPRKLKL